ncbi:MAG TPA: hypothetical protein VL495_09315 [Edaphobacter sp.]|jgi:tetratricopeptide (TPR) repeat protein|nr:hypothetical protein [Edaphobacter sp.]
MQNLLVAAWGTLGWILYQQGKFEEAENYLQASWKNNQNAEVALHLGQLAEKRGQKQEALHRYSLGFATTRKALPAAAPMKQPDLISTVLRKRIEALKKQGFTTNNADLPGELTKLRAFHVGSTERPNAMLECSFVIDKGKITLLRSTNSGPVPEKDDAMIKRASFQDWIPRDSDAHLLLKGFLNCHSGTCELITYPE